ncbi:MAG TPA: serine/threonine-protein kinase [Ktedonosporobacter sp.]|nr:serine/threonine-protein kinase [Ktedonosporobacter sp.]
MNIHPGSLGKYELQERLGLGNMAEVWKAFDTRLQRYVAIKFLNAQLQMDPSFRERFTREARAVASLRHPHIVRIYDFEAPETEDAPIYMVMDYIEGPTLADYLRTTSHVHKFPADAEIVALFSALSSAVDYAHQQHLLHRDIKPANILLDQRNTEHTSIGEPVLTDFGIVKMVGTAAGTFTNITIGTPFYISPEQAQGQGVSTASDLYSLGVILYECYTGEPPFWGDAPWSILRQHVTTPPPAPERLNPSITPALSAVILRALAKEPAQRFPSARALTVALAEALKVALPGEAEQPVSITTTSEQTLADEPEQIVESEETTIKTLVVKPALVATILPSPAAPPIKTPIPTTSPIPTPLTTPPARAAIPKRPGQRKKVAALLILFIVVLLASGLTATLLWNAAHTSNTVGSAFFTSSGAAPGRENKGLNDIFQLRLSQIPQPGVGKRYYAWLLPDQDQSESPPRALGPLIVNSEVATLPMPYRDPQHENLVATFSRFLVTEEDTNPPPQGPSLDTRVWRYYAAIPQTSPAPTCLGAINQLSVLCHLRHLLSGDPELSQVQLQGGLNFWFLNNVEEVQKWARESVDHQNSADIRHKLVNILYALDGTRCIEEDLQHGAPGLDNTPDDPQLATDAAIPLLDCDLTANAPGYLTHIHDHLNAMVMSPGVQDQQKGLAMQINTELNAIHAWLLQAQSDAHELLSMSNQQLLQSQGLSLRNEMDKLATNALSGGANTNTGVLEKGAVSMADQIQQLAIMPVVPYTGH